MNDNIRRTAQWDKLYFALIVELATQLRDAPQGLAQLAAELADAAMAERNARREASRNT